MNQDPYGNSGYIGAEEPSASKKGNTTLIVIAVVVVLLLLCCCCFGVFAWSFGDQILYFIEDVIDQMALATVNFLRF